MTELLLGALGLAGVGFAIGQGWLLVRALMRISAQLATLTLAMRDIQDEVSALASARLTREAVRKRES